MRMLTEAASSANHRVWLLAEFESRRKKNPAYSLQAFSRSLGVSAPSLSQVLSGKRPLSRKAALQIISRCSLSPEAAKTFLASALGLVWESGGPEPKNKSDEKFDPLDMDTFRLISDWHHFAILSLGDVKPNFAHPPWIADRLGISPHEAKDAFYRLLRLGLVKRRGRGFYQSTRALSIPTQRSTAAFRKFHGRMIAKALSALEVEEIPLELFSSMTMAVDESRIPEARALIKTFRRNLCALLETGRRTRVFTLAIQLFPISKV